MAVPTESLSAGRCYLVEGTGVWRIVRIGHQGHVEYEARGQRLGRAGTWKPGMLDSVVFAHVVERQVPCDWTPETDEGMT
jgi:hypothetical protein